MINPAKELRQINIHRKVVTFLDDVLNLLNRLLPIMSRAEPETIAREAGIENRHENLGNGLLAVITHSTSSRTANLLRWRRDVIWIAAYPAQVLHIHGLT